MTATTVIQLAAGLVFAVAALLAVIRIVRGPTILDRIIASDVLFVILMLVVGAEMVIDGHTRTIPIMLVLAGTSAFASIAVARYVSKQDRGAGRGSGGVSNETGSISTADPASDRASGDGRR